MTHARIMLNLKNCKQLKNMKKIYAYSADEHVYRVSVKFLMLGETNRIVGYHLSPHPACPGQCPGRSQNFLNFFLSIGLKKMFEKLKINTF